MTAAETIDPRRQRTRDVMEGAARDLIEERGLAGLSVATVTGRAGVSRSTFYDHYDSVDDLAEKACTAMFDALLAETPVQGADPGSNPLVALFDHVLAHRRLYSALLVEGGSAQVLNHLHSRMTVAVHVNRIVLAAGEAGETGPGPDGSSSSTRSDGPAESPHDMTASMLAGAVLGSIVDWLRRGCPGTASALAEDGWRVLATALQGGAVGTTGSAPARRSGSAAPSLEQRLRRVEDELAIQRLIMAYGPAADAGLAELAAARWTADGLYDWDAAQPPKEGRGSVARMLESVFHRQLMDEGVAHFAGPLLIDVADDTATAVNYSLIMRRDGDTFYLWRVSAVRWDLLREDSSWRVRRRTNRLLDESGVGRTLFGDTLQDVFAEVSA